MKEQKYIRYSDDTFDIFSMGENHSDVARKSGKNPVSAGFYRQYEGGDESMIGESFSLGIQSKEDDIKVYKLLK